MSKEQAIAFFEEISKNQQLAQEVEKVVKGKNSDEEKAKELISLAKKHNFNFMQEDAKNAQGALKTKLSPEKMLEVSGGKLNLKSSLMAAAMLLGLGAAGATMSNMEASAMKRRLADFSSSSDSDKRGKDENGQARKKGGTQQTAPQTVGRVNPRYHVVDAFPELATNLTQNETTPSNGQGAAQSDSQQTTKRTPPSSARTTSGDEQHATRSRKEKKVLPHIKRTEEAAQRFNIGAGIYMRMLAIIRACSGHGHLPNGDWPAAPVAQSGDRREGNPCRFCDHPLAAAGQEVYCPNEGCIYHWVYDPDMGSKPHGRQGGTSGTRHYARWALLPALILDSRLPTIGRGRSQLPRPAAIMTPAEAWAVWQLIVGHNNGWADVRTMMAAHNVDPTIQNEVVRLLEESYNNLFLGNESFIDLGSEVQQLVAGPNDDWQQIRTTMAQRGYNAEEAIKLLEKSCDRLTVEQRKQSELSKEERQQMLEEKRRQEEARRQAEDAIRQAREEAIEKLQSVDTLTDKQKKEIASRVARSGLVKCRCKKAPGGTGCDSNKVSFKNVNTAGNLYFRCNECAKSDGQEKGSFFTLTPKALLAMLEAAAPGNVSMEMADAEQNEQQRGTQDMSQFNPGQQMTMLRNTTHNDYGMDFDEDEDYVDRDFYDKDGNLRKLKEQRPPEEKERREDYENMQMMEENSPVENQTRHNVVPSAFRPSTEDFQIIEGTEFNQELQGSSQRHLQLMMPLQAERRFEMQHKDYENQETNPNIPQLPHLQPHRSMILENTNETITPLTTENLDDIGDALINEISNEAPDFARIQSMLQSAKEARANILQLRSFDDVLIMVKDAANYYGRDDIISLIDSWSWH